MLFHIIGGFIYGIICSIKYQPDYVIDTTGIAYTFLAFKLLSPKTKCLAYVHYPFISDDMINLVKEGKIQYNNQGLVAKYKIFKYIKLAYYNILCESYKRMGSLVSEVYCNSSWTGNHVQKLWKGHEIKILHPPCNIIENLNFSVDKRSNSILSLSQFRPEKNQALQIEIFSKISPQFPDLKFVIPK